MSLDWNNSNRVQIRFNDCINKGRNECMIRKNKSKNKQLGEFMETN